MSPTPATDVLYTKQVNVKVYCPPLVTPPTLYWPCCSRSTNQYSTGSNVAVLCCVSWMISCLKTPSCYVLLDFCSDFVVLCKCNKNYPLLCKCFKFFALLCKHNEKYAASFENKLLKELIHRKWHLSDS